ETYRNDPALSYSTLSRFDREGFNKLDSLFDKVESPSLTFGSAVDAIITGGREEFDNRFMPADFPDTPDSVIQIIKELFNRYSETCNNINLISNDAVIEVAAMFNYQNNWKPETRAKVIKEKGFQYYNLLYLSQDKTIIDTQTYQDVCKAVEALKNSEATKFYFADNNPFKPDIERFYQLKFKATLNDIDYRCMFDELVIFYDTKEILPIDLKTSCKKFDREWDFPKHYIEWNYQMQNRLYVRILQDVISKDDIYKDYKILPYKDIIVFRGSDTPLVWDIPFTFTKGTLYFGKDKQIEMKDPEDIGKELSSYLSSRPRVPSGIDELGSNNIVEWLNKL
ncbi:MAG: hypothetical protein ACI32H_02475, partial [Bacilli bacterium]